MAKGKKKKKKKRRQATRRSRRGEQSKMIARLKRKTSFTAISNLYRRLNGAPLSFSCLEQKFFISRMPNEIFGACCIKKKKKKKDKREMESTEGGVEWLPSNEGKQFSMDIKMR